MHQAAIGRQKTLHADETLSFFTYLWLKMAISWSSFPSPWCWVLLFFDVAILIYLVVFTLVAISHVVAMWFLRKEFVLAVRYGL